MYQLFLLYIKLALEVIGVLIIVFGILKMIGYFLRASFYKHFSIDEVVNEIRLKLSNYLVLSLEVIIGRDIIETLLNPSIEEILGLGALIVLRTLLAFFLNYEMKQAPKKQKLQKMFMPETKS